MIRTGENLHKKEAKDGSSKDSPLQANTIPLPVAKPRTKILRTLFLGIASCLALPEIITAIKA
jgi:hypothetical protein